MPFGAPLSGGPPPAAMAICSGDWDAVVRFGVGEAKMLEAERRAREAMRVECMVMEVVL